MGSVEFVAGLGGLAWFIGWAGLKVLRPTRIDWLLSGFDWSQHLMGWLFLRNESWKFPLGRLDNFLYPVGTTIGYTDSTPWVSLLLRPFSSLLPVDFQFIGPWLALCFFLQGAAGAWLAAAFTRDRTARLCSGVLFAASPVLLSRVVHDSLSSQWMIVVLIGLHVRRAADNAIVKRHLSAAFGLTVLSSLTHPYMAMMILGLAVALVIKLVVVDRSLDWTRGLLLGTALPVVSLLIFLLLGYFSGGVAPGAGGFDLYSADMLSFFNPSGRSRFLPNLQSVLPNLEGAGYLGLGTIVLMIFASIGLVAALADGLPPFHQVWPLGLVSVGFAIYALGPAPKLGNIELLQLNAVYQRVAPLISPFRSAGRFLWIFHYALLSGSIAIVLRSWKGRPWLATAAMVIASVLQLTDVKFDRRNPFDRTRIDAGLHSPLWKSIGAEYRHLALVPPQIVKYDSCQGELDGALRWPFAYVAYVQKMTFNSGYVARANDDAIRANCLRFTESVRRGELDTSTLYVVGPETLKALTASGSAVVCGRVDSYNVCVSGSSQGETRRYLETQWNG
jgi:hypothetical protein